MLIPNFPLQIQRALSNLRWSLERGSNIILCLNNYCYNRVHTFLQKSLKLLSVLDFQIKCRLHKYHILEYTLGMTIGLSP